MQQPANYPTEDDKDRDMGALDPFPNWPRNRANSSVLGVRPSTSVKAAITKLAFVLPFLWKNSFEAMMALATKARLESFCKRVNQ